MPSMRAKGWGKIINIGSVQSELARPSIAPYTATKGAVRNLTRGMATDWAQYGLQVNAIAPGFFSTNQNKFLLYDENGELTKRGRKIIDNTPMGRYGEVDELVGTILYLLSDVSKFVTGITIPVDGGYSAFGGV